MSHDNIIFITQIEVRVDLAKEKHTVPLLYIFWEDILYLPV